jgi:hypothetical protein
MAFQIFQISVHDTGAATDDLNRFLANHKVLSIDRRFVDAGSNSFWTFCVDYLDGAVVAQTRNGTSSAAHRNKVDYKDQLSPEDFAIFLKLREWRKATAQADAVPV